MLLSLKITNLLFIQNLHLNFHKGFSVITGETGSGKSLVIQSLQLGLGNRLEQSLIGSFSETLELEIDFAIADLPLAKLQLEEKNIPFESRICIRREVKKGGLSKNTINGISVQAQFIRQLAERIVDIHSQHEFHSLLDKAFQLELLDIYAGHFAEVRQLKNCTQDLQAWQKKLAIFEQQAKQTLEKLDFLNSQFEILGDILPSDELINELTAEVEAGAKIHSTKDQLFQATQLLENEQSGLLQSSTQLENILSCLEDKRLPLEDWHSSAKTISSLLKDLNREIQNSQDGLEIDPQELLDKEAQLNALMRVARNLHIELQQLPQAVEELREEKQELQEIQSKDVILSTISQYQEKYTELASKISANRQQAAMRLVEKVNALLPDLQLQMQFQVCFEPQKNAYSPSGLESVEFRILQTGLFQAVPLARAASGGELSRISLLVQLALAERVKMSALIFDEVDVGLSGAATTAVARMLKKLAEDSQVMCISHQNQIVAAAEHHYKAVKSVDSKSSSVNLELLEHEERVAELARIISGEEINESSLAFAREQLAVFAKNS